MSQHNEPIRELFIDELSEVTGGGPVEDLMAKLQENTTMACCEEGPDSCCNESPW